MRPVFRRVLVAVLAVIAVGAFASASASAALPEFIGNLPTTFTGSGGEISIEEETGSKYICKSSSITGTISGPKEVSKVTVKFPGCTSFCATTATKALETKELKGRIAYISKTQKTVGLLLEPVTEPVAECVFHSGVTAKIQGSIIGQLGGLNTKRKSPFELNFTAAGSNGRQSVQHFEGEALLHNLQILRPPFPSPFAIGLGSQISFSTEHEVEIRA
jgi:hypothetical protein